MSEVFDLAVIGGGPAGASAAITASQLGFSVVLLEAGNFPRHKVCGEFVSGEALSLLDALLGSSNLFASAPRISNARVFLDGQVTHFPVNPAATSIPRHRMDLALWEAAASSGVSTRDGCRVNKVVTGELFAIQVHGAELVVKSVINATGRWSNLAARQGVKSGTARGSGWHSSRAPNHNHWIGLKGHFFEESPAKSCDLYFFHGGYCGVQPLDDGTVNAAAMVSADIARSMQAVFSLNRNLESRTRSWKPASEPVSTSPLLFHPPRTSGGGMLLAGDAAAFLDPFAGDGISMALHSGRLAALALAPYIRGECSLLTSTKAYDRTHREMIQPALRNAARLRRLLELPKVLRLTAISLLRFPLAARIAVQGTRVRHGSMVETQHAASLRWATRIR